MVAVAYGSVAILVTSEKKWIVGVYKGEENGDIGLEGVATYNTTNGHLSSWTGHKEDPLFLGGACFPKQNITLYGSAAQWLTDLYCKSKFAPDYVKA